jgi:tRNA(Ile)-lysidine synthase
MAVLHPLEAKLAAAWPPEAWRDVTVLLAVSGGPDSVALLRAMPALQQAAGEGRIVAAHLNHQLRPGEADADEAFVADLCRRLGVACELGRARLESAKPPAPQAGGDGIEAAARQARYEFLEQAAARAGARYVVTAHTADDQAETILHHIIRGTGIAGLAGMARTRPLGPATLIRPLLGFRRAELLAYLGDLGQPYRDDSSNRDTRFTRNRIRHELLPWLAEEFNSGVVEALLRLGSLAGQAQEVIDGLAGELADKHVREESPSEVFIKAVGRSGAPCLTPSSDLHLHPYLYRELLMEIWRRQGWPMQAMGFAQWDLLEQMLTCPERGRAGRSAKQTFPGGISAERVESGLRLRGPG